MRKKSDFEFPEMVSVYEIYASIGKGGVVFFDEMERYFMVN